MLAQENKRVTVKPIIGRVGGKARIAPWILEHIKQHSFSIYCEPFAGSAAVYFALVNEGIPQLIRKRGHHFRAVLNDADSRIVQLFKTCRDYPELLAYQVRMTPYSREEHRIAQQDISEIEDEIEQARQFLAGHCQGSVDHSSGWSYTINPLESRDRAVSWNSLPSRILAASPYLQGYSGHEARLDELKAQGMTLFEALEVIEA